jgi:hypothetical protein
MLFSDSFHSSMNCTILPGVPTRMLQFESDWHCCCCVSDPPVARDTLICEFVDEVKVLRISDIYFCQVHDVELEV